jgi:hypothetical protein
MAQTITQDAVPSQFLQQPAPDTGFRGVNLNKPAQKIPISDVAKMDNMWIVGGRLVSRPGIQGMLATKMGGPIYCLTEFAATDTSHPPNVTSWLAFVCLSKLYMAQVNSSVAPTEIKLGGTGGISFNLNGPTVRLNFSGPFLSVIDGVGPMYLIHIPYVNPSTAYIATESVALVPPTAAPPAQLTNQVIDPVNDASAWNMFPALTWPGGVPVAAATSGVGGPETISNAANQQFTGGAGSPSPNPTGWLTGGDTMGFQASSSGVGLECFFDAGQYAEWVDWDYPTPTYGAGTNTINNARVYATSVYGHSSLGGKFSLQMFAEDALTVPRTYTTTITAATNATPIVVTAAGHGLSNGQQVTVASVGGNTAANGLRYIGGVTTNTFALYSDAALTVAIAGNGAYTSGGTVTVTAATSFTDLVIVTTGSSSTITSAAHPFQASDAGKVITVFGGTGFILGNFTITAVNAGTHVATLNGNVGILSSTGGIAVMCLDSNSPGGDKNFVLSPPPSMVPGSTQTSPTFTCTTANTKFSNLFSFSALNNDFDYTKFRILGPASQSGPCGVNTPSMQVVDVRIIVANAGGATGLHLSANNPVSVGANCLGGVWIRRDFSGAPIDLSGTNILSMSYSAPPTSGQIPFRFGIQKAGDPIKSIYWTNQATYTSDGSAFFVDISTILPAVRAHTAYLYLQVITDLPDTIDPTNLCTISNLAAAGNLTLHQIYGGLGGDYSYQYTEANCTNDSSYFLDVVESDPSPISSPPIEPDGVHNQAQLILGPPVNPASTHYFVYRFGGALTDGQWRLIARLSMSKDISLGSGSTTYTYSDLVLVNGQSGRQVASTARPFQAGDVGQILQITTGLGFVPGSYPISAVSGGVATLGVLTTSAGIAGSTSGGGNLIVPTSTISWNHSARILVDSTADSTLLTGNPVFMLTGRTGAPLGATCIGTWQNRIWVARDATVNGSWLTTAGNNTSLYFNTINVPDPNDIAQSIKGAQFDAGGANDPIMALVPLGSYLAVMKQRSIYLVSGTDAGSFTISPHLLSAGTGLLAPLGWCLVNNSIWFMAADGIREYDGGDTCLTRSKDIEPSLNPKVRNLPPLNAAAYRQSVMIHHGERIYVCCPGSPSDNTPSQCWVFDPFAGGAQSGTISFTTVGGGWVGPWTNFNMTSAASLTGSANTDDLYWGGQDGQIYHIANSGDIDLSSSSPSPVAINFVGRAFGQENMGALYFREDRTNYINADIVTNEANVTVTLGCVPKGGVIGGSWSQTYALGPAGQYSLRLPVSSDVIGMSIQPTISASTITPFEILGVALETVDASPGGD